MSCRTSELSTASCAATVHHWVGDGFRVVNLLPGGTDAGDRLSPFLLLDYHPPYHYQPTDRPRGVGAHPHRGFETVTMAFQGAVAHHDSAGGGGVIRTGDVQWMTAASGILHKEYHEAEWARLGGTFQMLQLWVNLPAAHKMDPPRYQPLAADQMGVVELADGAGTVRVVAGEYQGVRGPAVTMTPINLWDVHLAPGGRLELSFPEQENTGVLVIDGTAVLNGTTVSSEALAVFDNDGTDVVVESGLGARLVLLNGAPIDEPTVSYGPFVMNSHQEIIQAVDEFNAGKFGHLS